jgi:hypothetical protein
MRAALEGAWRRVFAGDPRVWRVATVVGAPLALLILGWCLVPVR